MTLSSLPDLSIKGIFKLDKAKFMFSGSFKLKEQDYIFQIKKGLLGKLSLKVKDHNCDSFESVFKWILQ